MTDSFLIKKPWVTEKSTDLNKDGKYVFMVKSGAAKNEIKKAIQTIYNVKVVAVNTVNRPEKIKRFRSSFGRQPGYRKAIVTLAKGDKIDVQ